MKENKGANAESGFSEVDSNFHPLQPPPEPPSKLYEDDDFDLYADIEPPTPTSSKLAPPPEPPALLFALDSDEKEEGGGEGSDEETGLVIDDRNDAYDPEMPTSPPSPSPSEVEDEDKKKPKKEKTRKIELPLASYPALEDIPPPPSPPPEKDNDSDSECPNQGLYSKLSMEIAKGKSDSDISDKEDDILPAPPLPPFGKMNLSIPGRKSSLDVQEEPENLAMDKKGKLSDSSDDKEVESVEKMDDDAGDDESIESVNKPTVDSDNNDESPKAGPESDEVMQDNDRNGNDSSPKEIAEKETLKPKKTTLKEIELSEGELEDEEEEDETGEQCIESMDIVERCKEQTTAVPQSTSDLESNDDNVPSEDGTPIPLPFTENCKLTSDSESKDKQEPEELLACLNGSQESLSVAEGKTELYNKPGKTKANSSGERENDGEHDVLELGCEEERDGLVDITDEEISNYERSWEMEDNRKKGKTAGLDGLETEAISDCEYPPAESEMPETDKPMEIEQSVGKTSDEAGENGKEEEGEIVAEEKIPVQWKKLSKTTKERSYRGDKEVKNKEKNKEITKKKEKRKELERYDVRKLISEKPRRKVDEFGRDISSNSRSNSRSLSRGRRSVSRGKKRRSDSRSRSHSRSKERVKERPRSRERVKERSRDRSRERSRERSRSKEKVRRDRSRSKKRSRRSRTPRKDRGRSRERSSRERKKRKKSPSMSCSSCSCSSCEREKRRSNKKLTVIVTNEEVVGKRGRDKSKPKTKEKKAPSPKNRRRTSPLPSKEVFTSGDNILVSVNFKSSKGGEGTRSKEVVPSAKRKKDDDARKKKDKGTKENQPMRSIVTAKKSNRRKLNTKNIKPVAIIDLEASPFRETILSPKEIIILTDSDSEDKLPQTENTMPVSVTGPKTPPEPLIKFNIVNNKQQQLRTMANPLLDSLMEQLEGEGDDEPDEIMHKGPNTPPEPPVPYDPFEPTKSRSPTPCPDTEMDRHQTPPPENNQRHSPQQLPTPLTPPKLPQHVAPKTPSPLHSPPKVIDEPADKPKLLPFQPAGMDSGDDSGGAGGAGGGGDSPYSPGSSEGDDLFEPPPMPQSGPPPKAKPRPAPPMNNKQHLPLPKVSIKKRPNKAHKETSKKAITKKEIGIKLDEDQLKILDELPNSAVEMQVKDKFLKKLNRQERVVEEVKMVLKPHYAKKHVSKEEYKEILRKAVPKICHSRSGEINPMKIQRLIEAYVKKYRHKTKKRGGSSAIPPLRQNKAPTKTMWC